MPRLFVVPAAQQLVLSAWALMALGLVGLGLGVRRLLGAAAEDPDACSEAFWLGWAGLIVGLQLWHCFLPVDVRATSTMAGVALLGYLSGGLAPWRAAARRLPRTLPVHLGALAVAVWLSNHALGGPRYGDSGAYFIPTLTWVTTYPVVPGIANLLTHLGLNQSYFFYVAAVAVGPFAGRGFHLANGLLMWALCANVIGAAWRLVASREAGRPRDLFFVLMAPGIVPLGLGLFVTSPIPEPAVFALGTVAIATLLSLLAADREGAAAGLRVLVFVALAGVTVKLTFGGLAVMTLLVGVGVWLARGRPSFGEAARMVGNLGVLGLLVMGPWVARNVVMSGAPLFPMTTIILPVEWRVQSDIGTWFQSTVYHGDLATIVADPRWFLQILRNWGWDAPEVAGPLLVGLTATTLAVLRRLFSRGAVNLAIVLPPLASLGFCLVMAPVPRYAAATMSAVAATGILVLASDLLGRRRIARCALVLAVVTCTVLTTRRAVDPLWLPLATFETTPVVPYETRVLETGLAVNVPTTSDACWTTPLPCTGYLNPSLKLRRQGDLSHGFMLDPALQERYRYDPGRPGAR